MQSSYYLQLSYHLGTFWNRLSLHPFFKDIDDMVNKTFCMFNSKKQPHIPKYKIYQCQTWTCFTTIGGIHLLCLNQEIHYISKAGKHKAMF